MKKGLYNAVAVGRIAAAYPDAATGAVKLIEQAEKHGAGSAEIVLRYDKPGDPYLGKYEVMICLRVQERED
jgi:hypothetical protein